MHAKDKKSKEKGHGELKKLLKQDVKLDKKILAKKGGHSSACGRGK